MAEKFELLGASVESGADWDSAFAKITMLSDRVDEATTLLVEVLSEPAFPEREVERLKAERLAEILQLETEPRGLADEKFSEFLYSASSRYSKPDEGSSESVSGLLRDDVEEFYRTRYRTGSTTVVVAGDVSADKARTLVTNAFRAWASGTSERRQLIATPRANRKTVHIINKPDAPQSELRIGHVGLPRKNPDFFHTLVMKAVRGGLFGSRINLNLREAHGYTYGASSFYDWRRGPGPFVVSTAVQSEVTTPALREILLRSNEFAPRRLRKTSFRWRGLSCAKAFSIRYGDAARRHPRWQRW